MFWLIISCYILIDVYSLTDLCPVSQDKLWMLSQAQMSMACMCGMMSAVNPSPKRKSAMIVLFLGAIFVFLTGLCCNVAEIVHWFEIMAYSVGIIWAGARPYNFVSDPITKDTVCILFYKANNGSWLMHILSLIGLPVSSMSIIAEDYWLKLVLDRPGLEIHLPDIGDKKNYVVIDTDIRVTKEIKDSMIRLQGTLAVSPWSLFLRVRCIAAVKPLLKLLGYEWFPNTIIEQIPSIYLYKALWNRQNRGS